MKRPRKPAVPPSGNWIVRFKRRCDGRKYYYRHDGCLTARKESSMRLDEETARQLADSISRNHPDFYAWAVPYSADKTHNRKAAADAAKLAETMSQPSDAVTCQIVQGGDNA